MFGFLEKALFGYSSADLQAESDSLDAQLAAQNDAALARGAIDQPTHDQTSANISASNVDAAAQIDGAFKEGLAEGIDNTENAIRTGVAAPFKFTWAIIPWQLLVAGGVALFVYMGAGFGSRESSRERPSEKRREPSFGDRHRGGHSGQCFNLVFVRATPRPDRDRSANQTRGETPKIMNWKTTVFGAIAAVGAAFKNSTEPHLHSLGVFMEPIGIYLLGHTAADANGGAK
jgi:hypothetical protein